MKLRFGRTGVACLLLALALLRPGAAAANGRDAPDSYEHRFPIRTPTSDSLQRLRVPLAVLQRSLDDTAARRDLRIFDATGVPLPIAWAAEPLQPQATLTQAALTPRPWPSSASGTPAPDVHIEWQSGQGEVLRISRTAADTAGSAPVATAPVAWLLDLKALGEQRPLQLLLSWEPQAQGLELGLRAESSLDAQQWQTAGRAVLVQLPGSGSETGLTVQRQLVLQNLPREHRYLRLVADRPLALSGVMAEWRREPAATDERLLDQTRFAVGAEGVVDFGTVLRPRQVRFHLASETGLVPLMLERPSDPQVHSRRRDVVRDTDSPWTFDASHTAWRFNTGGQFSESPALEWRGQPVRRWRLRLVGEAGALPQAMTLSWVAPQLVFVASGKPPYQLSVGRRDAPAAALALSALIPGHQGGAEYRLPEAQLLDTPAAALDSTPTGAAAGPGAQRRWLLWAVLVAAVSGMGVLAWKLAADLRERPAAPPPT